MGMTPYTGAESSRQKGGFAGLPLDDALPTREFQARCGLFAVNLQRGTIGMRWR